MFVITFDIPAEVGEHGYRVDRSVDGYYLWADMEVGGEPVRVETECTQSWRVRKIIFELPGGKLIHYHVPCLGG